VPRTSSAWSRTSPTVNSVRWGREGL